jgi:hypothetical protein
MVVIPKIATVSSIFPQEVERVLEAASGPGALHW